MRVVSTVRRAAFLAAMGVFAVSAQASRLGHPGVSTTGVKGAPTQWQLLCDPADATSGSTTTAYSAYDINGLPLASLGEVDPVEGFVVTAVELQVEYPISNVEGLIAHTAIVGPTQQFTSSFIEFTPTYYGGPVTINQSQFPTGAYETGIAQVFWAQYNANIIAARPAISIPTPPAGDVNTHMLIFNNLSGNPNAMATFMDYLDSGQANGGITPTPDSYTGTDDNGDSFTYSADPTSPNYQPIIDTQPATFEVGTPEPSSMALAGVVCGLGMLRRRRRA